MKPDNEVSANRDLARKWTQMSRLVSTSQEIPECSQDIHRLDHNREKTQNIE
jgi:hypothetical protein